MARAETTDAVAQVDSIHSTRALHRPMMDREYHGITLHEWNDFRA
jgi:hypothetical protein